MTRAMLAVVVAVGCTVASRAESPSSRPAGRQWAVSVCDGYLGGLDAEDVWSAGRAVGVSRLEASINRDLACPHLFEKGGRPHRIDTPAACEALRAKLAKEGFTIGCFCLIVKLEAGGNDDAILRWIEEAAAAAPSVGCRTMMLPIGVSAAGGERLSDEAFVDRCRPFVRKLDAIAARTGVQLVLENLGHYWNRPEILEPVLCESRADRVGLLLDTTNLYWFGHPLDRVYEIARKLAPFVRSIHVKNIRYPADQQQKQRTPGWEYGKYAEPIRTGDIDFVRVLGPIARAGYVGDLTIEDDSLPHYDAAGKRKVLADDVAYLRDLIRRFPPPTGDIGDVETHRIDGATLHLQCSRGWARLTACEPAIIRVEAGPAGATRSEWQALDVRAIAPTSVTLVEGADQLQFVTGELRCVIDKQPFRITWYRVDVQGALTRPGPGPWVEWTDEGVQTRLQMEPKGRERVYGLNLNFLGFERRGRALEVKTNADPGTDNGHSHVVSPFFLTAWGYGVFLNNRGYSRFRIDDEGDGVVTMYAPGRVLDWYYIYAGGLRDVLEKYTSVVGRIDMPARWGLGLWYRAEAKWKQEQVKAAAAEFRRRRIPCDVIGLEPGWQSHAYSCSYAWNKDNYPDPPSLLKWLGDNHFRLNLWTHAFVHPTSSLYKPLLDGGCAADRRVWEGLVPDFTLPKTAEVFDRDFTGPQIEMGVSGYKLDECDGSDSTGGWFFPDDTRFPGGWTGAQMHNVFGALYQQAFQESFRKRNRRTCFLGRANFATGSRTATAAYSDLYDLRQYLRAQASAGFLGTLWCPEVRQTATTAEFIRRCQLMFLSPLVQLDGWNSGVLPWEKGPEAEAVFRRFAELRMRLVPYLYSEFWKMHTRGIPIVRSLVQDNREDPDTVAVDDQFMLGDSILVAPVLSGSQREAYFPNGRWSHLETGETVHGGSRIGLTAPFDRVPLYVRDGTVLPLGPATQYVDEPSNEPWMVHVYGGQSGRFDLFEDDGVTYDYEKGRYAVTPIEYREWIDRREFRIGPAKGTFTGQATKRGYVVVFHNVPRPLTFRIDGRDLARASDDPVGGRDAGWFFAPDGTIRVWLPDVLAEKGAVVGLAAGKVEADAEGFVPMFNGRDLSGWQIMGRGGDWHVENGEVFTTGRSGEFLDWIRSADEYEDFVLRLEYNMSRNCNSGVFIRTTETGRQSRTGMEIQIYDGFGKPIDRFSSGAIYDVAPPLANPVRPAGEWNQLEIDCRGRRLKVTLNGTRIQDVNLDDPAVSADVPDGRKLWQRAKRGFIGFQNHRCPIRFRNVRMRAHPGARPLARSQP